MRFTSNAAVHLAACLAIVALSLTGCNNSAAGNSGASAPARSGKSFELLNVSYDPTRELWKQLNEQFIAQYKQQTGHDVTIKQSHGGSSSQARAVIDGLEADVVTLAMVTDTEAVQKSGLIAADWSTRLPNGSLPYSSTIVFVVRKDNPKGVKDWNDLIKPDVQVITPNPKTSGNGKLSFLGAWGSVRLRGGSDEDALKLVTELYKHVPVLDSGARAATTTFAQKNIGDVHLTWENEAHLEVHESNGALEIVYPPISILAEPRVAWVDKNVEHKGTAEVAKAYLEFLYTEDAQRTIGRNFYRPSKAEILAEFREQFPTLQMFSIKELASDWAEADKRFFAEGAVFDSIYTKP
ncbi:MAG: sulfate ABC transporter substrate-binding protein [Pirellulales bacterium]|nr:sulfate ABC transporter substrate-binding protein [Pirellulales bacterium]